MSARRAREVIEAAVLEKALDWQDTRHWHVVSGGQVLVVIAPSYSGTSISGRNGWTWWLAALGPSDSSRRETTIEQAAARGLAAWQRWATAKENR
jgi:hypothetical protein